MKHSGPCIATTRDVARMDLSSMSGAPTSGCKVPPKNASTTWVGEISLSAYLWHFPLLLLLGQLGWMAGDTLPGMVSNIVVLGAIVEATADVVSAFKPNLAFWLAEGLPGLAALQGVIEAVPDGIPVILDGKFGDIGHTAAAYARAAFDQLGADAVTANPYLGVDALRPFLERAERGVFLLARTSNPSARQVQDLSIAGRPLFAEVARLAVAWQADFPGACGLVVGATYPQELETLRQAAQRLPFLIPGIGAQGGIEGAFGPSTVLEFEHARLCPLGDQPVRALIACRGALREDEERIAVAATQLPAHVMPVIGGDEVLPALAGLRWAGDIDQHARQGLVRAVGEQQVDAVVDVPLNVGEIRRGGAAVHLRPIIEVAHTTILTHDGVRVAPAEVALRPPLPGLTHCRHERLSQQVDVLGDGHVVRVALPDRFEVLVIGLPGPVAAERRRVGMGGADDEAIRVQFRQPVGQCRTHSGEQVAGHDASVDGHYHGVLIACIKRQRRQCQGVLHLRCDAQVELPVQSDRGSGCDVLL